MLELRQTEGMNGANHACTAARLFAYLKATKLELEVFLLV